MELLFISVKHAHVTYNHHRIRSLCLVFGKSPCFGQWLLNSIVPLLVINMLLVQDCKVKFLCSLDRKNGNGCFNSSFFARNT